MLLHKFMPFWSRAKPQPLPMSVPLALATFGAIIDRRGKIPRAAWNEAFEAFKLIVTKLDPKPAGILPPLGEMLKRVANRTIMKSLTAQQLHGAMIMYDEVVLHQERQE